MCSCPYCIEVTLSVCVTCAPLRLQCHIALLWREGSHHHTHTQIHVSLELRGSAAIHTRTHTREGAACSGVVMKVLGRRGGLWCNPPERELDFGSLVFTSDHKQPPLPPMISWQQLPLMSLWGGCKFVQCVAENKKYLFTLLLLQTRHVCGHLWQNRHKGKLNLTAIVIQQPRELCPNKS